MANFHSSLSAMVNLTIGLARGFRKERNRLLRRRGTDEGSVRRQLRSEMLETITEQLGDYFPARHKEQLALALMDAVEMFEEQR